MSTLQRSNCPCIEVRGFKWPERPTANAHAWLIGSDEHGRWLGIRQGDPWAAADGAQRGVFDSAFVKLIPSGTYWSACFNQTGYVIDVDIILPVRWHGSVVAETDLELDVLCSADGRVRVRDQDTFASVRRTWPMPDEIAAAALTTCAHIRQQLEQRVEPFASHGRTWLERWLAAVHP